tara:strand:- start:182 stop:484 length:303 start_codon:yes stop_codon:yes gene_type:complete
MKLEIREETGHVYKGDEIMFTSAYLNRIKSSLLHLAKNGRKIEAIVENGYLRITNEVGVSTAFHHTSVNSQNELNHHSVYELNKIFKFLLKTCKDQLKNH